MLTSIKSLKDDLVSIITDVNASPCSDSLLKKRLTNVPNIFQNMFAGVESYESKAVLYRRAP